MISLALAMLALAGPDTLMLEPIAVVDHEPLDEMSGIVASIQYDDVYWVHNDSGDSARIFAMRGDGTVIVPDGHDPDQVFEGITVEGALNRDWETIAIDGDLLYIGDVGNNANARQNLTVYVVKEPNPNTDVSVEVLSDIPIRYPDQQEFPAPVRMFDCEAMFVKDGYLYLITKHRLGATQLPANSGTVYRVRLDDPEHRVERLQMADFGGWVTAADISPDGRTFAVLSHAPVASIWLFEWGSGDSPIPAQGRRLILLGARQAEAICFTRDGRYLLITNEQRDLFRVAVSRVRSVESINKID